MTERRGKRLLGNVLLTLVSIIVTLGLAELFLQIQEPYLRLTGTRAEWALGRYAAHPVWHHWHRPDRVTGVPSFAPQANPEPIITRVNALGCKEDREFEGPAPAGVRRILVLGDSFTEGYYPEDGFAGVLERRLNELDTGLRHEVINCGTSSYSPLLHYLRFTGQLASLAPDEVIVNIDLTDVFDDNVRYREGTVFDAAGVPVSAGPRRFSWALIMNDLRYRFYLVRLVAGTPVGQIRTYTYDEIFQHHNGTLEPGTSTWEEHVAFTLELLERLIDAVAAAGGRTTLTMYPYREQIDSTHVNPPWHRAFETRMAEMAERKGTAFYSAFEDLRALHESGVALYWSNDFHYSYTGQRAWSESFADYYIAANADTAAGR